MLATFNYLLALIHVYPYKIVDSPPSKVTHKAFNMSGVLLRGVILQLFPLIFLRAKYYSSREMPIEHHFCDNSRDKWALNFGTLYIRKLSNR